MPADRLTRQRFDVDEVDLPLALADLHRQLEPDATVRIELGRRRTGGRRPPPRSALLAGAGFVPERTLYRRQHTLPDYVGLPLRVLLVGLNPSLYAATAGVGFARPGNRFWPALLASGLATKDRDPRDALERHGIGMTDLVKRATVGADELRPAEYIAGYARVRALVEWLEPRVVCFVGLGGYRAAVDRRAIAGHQPALIGTSRVYVMPNPSGLNAHATVASLAAHFRSVRGLAGC